MHSTSTGATVDQVYQLHEGILWYSHNPPSIRTGDARGSFSLAAAGCLADPSRCRTVELLDEFQLSKLYRYPWGKGGLEISFSGSAIFRFVQESPPTTDRRRMRDEQGRIWLMIGHHSLTPEEQSGFHNRITVSSVGPAVGMVHLQQPETMLATAR